MNARRYWYLSWWALPSWLVPLIVLTGLFAYSAWVEWCLS